MKSMAEAYAVTYSLGALLDGYPAGHSLHALAGMALHLAEHPAIPLIDVDLIRHEDGLIAIVRVRVKPAAYPLPADELTRFGDAVEAATGLECLCALPAQFPSGRAEPELGHQLIFGQVPA